MDISLMREILEGKMRMNRASGMARAQALHAAQAELTRKAGQVLSGVDLFCFRARLAGAARALAPAGGYAEKLRKKAPGKPG